MTKEEFINFLELQEEISNRTSILYKNFVDLINYNDQFYSVIKLLGESLFSKEGWEHISCYEENSSQQELYTKGNPMCWDGTTGEPFYWNKESLYDYLIKQNYLKCG